MDKFVETIIDKISEPLTVDEFVHEYFSDCPENIKTCLRICFYENKQLMTDFEIAVRQKFMDVLAYGSTI